MWDYYAHTQGGEAILKLNEIHVDENIPQLLGNAVRKGKDLQREPRHVGQALQSRHRHQMLVRDPKKTSTRRPKDYLR
jgi:hypothetical protein